MSISEVHERQIEWWKPPVGHHLDETTRAEEFRLADRWQFTAAVAREQGGSETSEIIYGEARPKNNGFLGPVLVHKAPICLWLTPPQR